MTSTGAEQPNLDVPCCHVREAGKGGISHEGSGGHVDVVVLNGDLWKGGALLFRSPAQVRVVGHVQEVEVNSFMEPGCV